MPGQIQQAATTLVAADELAQEGEGVEPDVLVALGELYFEAYGEVESPVSRAHSPAVLYHERGDLARAKPLYERALAIREKSGPVD